MKAMEKYTRVMAEVKALHEENKKRLRDTTNRQDSVRKQEVISKLEVCVCVCVCLCVCVCVCVCEREREKENV